MGEKIFLKKPKGFTLVELMVVIAIIGILAAFGVAKYVNITDGGKKAALESHHREYILAIKVYKTNHPYTIPTSKSDLSDYMSNSDLDDNPKNSTYKIQSGKLVSELTLSMGGAYTLEFEIDR